VCSFRLLCVGTQVCVCRDMLMGNFVWSCMLLCLGSQFFKCRVSCFCYSVAKYRFIVCEETGLVVSGYCVW